ncbi:MAG: MarR family winged helix-turn-helix transcriptional regulator [Lautropia sp.]
MITRRQIDDLEGLRRYGIGRLLLLARRDLMARLERDARRRGAAVLAPAISAAVPFIDLEGTRSTELARRLGVTKQAVGRVVTALEAEGLVTRTVDEADGRAYLVAFTEAGLRYLVDSYRAMRRIEREYERIVGADELARVRRVLTIISYGSPADTP